MICQRLVRNEFISLDSDFLTGEHTKGSDYRWNSRGTAAVYLGDNEKTVMAECGKYWICDAAERINNSIAAIRGRPPHEWTERIKAIAKIDALLATIDVNDTLPFLDFSDPVQAQTYFSEAGFESLTLEDARKNAYLADPEMRTSKIGSFHARNGCPLIKVLSARTDGLCFVLFPGNYNPISARVIEKKQVSLFALDTNGDRVTGDKIVRLNEQTFEYEIEGETYSLTPLKL